MGFSRRGYWRGLSCPPPGDLPDPGTVFRGTEFASLRLRWWVLYYQRHLWRPASQFSYTCWEGEFSKLLGGSDGKESACNMEDLGLMPGSRRSPGEGKGYPLQYSGLENSMHWGAWSMGSPESDMTKRLSLEATLRSVVEWNTSSSTKTVVRDKSDNIFKISGHIKLCIVHTQTFYFLPFT